MVVRRSCDSCLYFGPCGSNSTCKYFTPVEDDDPDGSAADAARAEEYIKFLDAWYEYVREYE